MKKLSFKNRLYRIIAVYLLMNFVTELFIPLKVFALTNGPGQPEFQTFTPASATEMVNLFTGDFSYNLPLMTVPGPNGGYPINLAYNAGIGMEQEASWVGLGWNINAGAINRSMRGLPDDFKGDVVKKTLHFKPSASLILNAGKSIASPTIKNEFMGFNSLQSGLGVQVVYNNYSGIGFQFAGNFALGNAGQFADYYSYPLRINLTSASDGIGVNINYSNAERRGSFMLEGGSSVGVSWGSREGLTAFNVGYSNKNLSPFVQSNGGAGVSFSKSSYAPVAAPEMEGFMSSFGLEIGAANNGNYDASKISSVEGSLASSWIKNTVVDYNAYGYMNEEYSNAENGTNILQDVNRDKDVAPGRKSVSLGVPHATYDAYNASAQGFSGSFRAYRNDAGIYTENNVESTIHGGRLGGENGIPVFGTFVYHNGFNVSYSQSRTESGMWKNPFWLNGGNQGWEDIQNYYNFTSIGNQPLYEPFYLKMAGELTTSNSARLASAGNSNPVRLKLEESFKRDQDNNICPRPEIADNALYKGVNQVSNTFHNNAVTIERQKTVSRNVTRSNAQLNAFASSFSPNIYTTRNSFEATGGTSTPIVYDYAARPGHHIGEFTETGADGSRYLYSLPLYNNETKEVLFAKDGFSIYPTAYQADYSSIDASINNNEGLTDQLYSENVTPDYAATYLLGAVVSPDYVDVTGDGLSEDDLGYYSKFNYVRVHENYQWRFPYSGAILSSGHLSNNIDDKLSYQYGNREVYLLHSIETKTHVACFVLQDTERDDAHGAIAEFIQSTGVNSTAVGNAAEMYALDHISLYSKADPNYGTANATPIKTAHFEYDYSLCPGTPNNVNSAAGGGKLTLTKVYFTYRNNNKGELSPYSFEYKAGASYTNDENPPYNPLGNDRWGTFMAQSSSLVYRNNENPYTKQNDQATANNNSSAWCLRKIHMPSGATLSIKYEADDYAYVQNKEAQQMCEVIGFIDKDVTSPNLSTDVKAKIRKKNTRVCFKLNEAIPAGWTNAQKQDAVYKYIDGVDELYFKLFMYLKNASIPNYSAQDLYDYVDGFCKIENDISSCGVVNDGSSDHLYAYFTVELVSRDDYPGPLNLSQVHPFEKAAWQHIYLERPDMFNNPSLFPGTLTNLAQAATTICNVQEIARAVAPYITANVSGWGNKIDINEISHEPYTRPSYVRLNSPVGKKIGGGHRVASIEIMDGWDAMTSQADEGSSHGQQYSYNLPDGRSSGVTSYEPILGGEENAMVLPLRYDSDNLIKKDGAFYVTEPLAESYYPAPVVGYSRVTVSSKIDEPVSATVTAARTGKTVYEFYTAKDYPVQSDKTDLQKTWFPVPIMIPFVGSLTYNVRGFSQGYVVELNDMHGKLRSVAAYPAYANPDNQGALPVRKVIYKYNGGYQENTVNRLSSTVDILTADGVHAQGELGMTHDMFFDLRQHSNVTQEYGMQTNINTLVLPPAFYSTWPTFLPIINNSKSLFRSAVTMKVIHRTGILTEVETIDDGARSTARNLMFDAETGAPLLTEVINEFERPVYTYNFAAHWAYEGMQGAYKNQGVKFGNQTTDASGQLTITDVEKYFFNGDEVMYIPASGSGQMLWVTDVNTTSDEVTFKDAAGNDAANLTGDFIIHRSGRRNLQSVSNGVIVSLSNPVEDRTFPLLDAFNAYTPTFGEGNSQTLENFYTDCVTGEAKDVTITWNGTQLMFVVPGEGCEAYATFPQDQFSSLNDAFSWDLTYAGGQIIATSGSETVTATWTDPSGCFTACLDNVLHASAVRFSDKWNANSPKHEQAINYADAGLTMSGTYNPYLFGELGVWRTHSNYLYQVDRKQTSGSSSGTDISKDGTYKHFVIYNWEILPQDNTHWSFVSEVTRYSPYGYALETRDALGLYSSTMFGYSNTKQTASAANAQYFEMAYDGFEDYNTTYSGHGHLLFSPVNPSYPGTLSNAYAHTGSKSFAVSYLSDVQFTSVTNGAYPANQMYFEAQPGQEYQFSVWARATGGGTPAVTINNGVTTNTYTPDNAQSPIEGWKKIDVRFTAPSSGGTLTITLQCENSGTAYFDDLRIQPFRSAMTTSVYDPQTHWLLAELDNRNFATFYNYDEEGALVQVKQETEKGIFTVQTSRANIKRQ
jgi:hypothetical protein